MNKWQVISAEYARLERELDAHYRRRGVTGLAPKIIAVCDKHRELWTPENRLAREEFVLAKRDKGKTFREIAELLGVTVERARQIHVRAERRRRIMTSKGNSR